MEERVKIIEYDGHDIIYADHRGLRQNELLENVKRSFRTIEENREKVYLNLVNWDDTFTTKEVMDYLKCDEAVRIMKNQKKSALVGITGIKKVFLNIFSKLSSNLDVKVRAFDTEDDAKAWLTSD